MTTKTQIMAEVEAVLRAIPFKNNEQAALYALDAMAKDQPARVLLTGNGKAILTFLDTIPTDDLIRLHAALTILSEFGENVSKLIVESVVWRLGNKGKSIREGGLSEAWEAKLNE